MQKLGLLNTSILTSDGVYRLEPITLCQAQDIVACYDADNLDSAIGHQSTADILTELLGVDIPLNRQMFVQQDDQQAIVFKLNGRLEEGKVLTREEIDEIGYSFNLLTKIPSRD